MARTEREVDPAARTRRALLALLEGDLDVAEHELAEVVRADSSDAVAYLALAHLYRGRGEIGRALRVHQNLLLRSDLGASQRGQVLRALAADLKAGGYLERAIAAYEQVLEEDPRRSDAVDALVELFAQSGQHERAIALLKRSAGWLKRVDPQLYDVARVFFALLRTSSHILRMRSLPASSTSPAPPSMADSTSAATDRCAAASSSSS